MIRQDVPDAVAGENDELPIVVDRLDGNLGATRDNLLRKASRENNHLTSAKCNSSIDHSYESYLIFCGQIVVVLE